jgi:cellulose synthase/poly-beta-1,6-N-acetylglucosamine synthase-like glycosyltransferase
MWFHPRMLQLLEMADGLFSWFSLLFFILFVEFAWLYGLFNLGVVVFAFVYRFQTKNREIPKALSKNYTPDIAVLYTTCNDFVEQSARSCVEQNYPNYTVYILDDSSDETYRKRIDDFSSQFPRRVKVIRRKDRQGFKAGNLNHGLGTAAPEPYFAIADADEILPPDFLQKLVPYLEADSSIGFVQANHCANPSANSSLAKSMGIGIDIHWRWYQPLRNKYGFVMFLGHGALLRRECWEAIGGFPEIVSEDLAFAIRIREHGWRGYFAEEVVCYEDFPESVRAFRVRHMKWTRGTCEFLSKEMFRLIFSRNITWAEKFDILFPTLNLPLTLFYFLFMINANIVFPLLFGVQRDLTLSFAGKEIILGIYALESGFNVIYNYDFFIITVLTFIAPILCFILEMWKQPFKLFRFLCHSTAVYASLGPLSAIGVFSYLVTGKAHFLVTGDKQADKERDNKLNQSWNKYKEAVKEFFGRSHPDNIAVQFFEISCGILFTAMCLYLFQISFFGLSLAFILIPVMHHTSWSNVLIEGFRYLPFTLVALGLVLGAFAMLGLQTMFFSFGFHF